MSFPTSVRMLNYIMWVIIVITYRFHIKIIKYRINSLKNKMIQLIEANDGVLSSLNYLYYYILLLKVNISF